MSMCIILLNLPQTKQKTFAHTLPTLVIRFLKVRREREKGCPIFFLFFCQL